MIQPSKNANPSTPVHTPSNSQPDSSPVTGRPQERITLIATCLLAIAAYAAMSDLKGIDTDEGLRLAITNGARPFVPGETTPVAWGDVLQTGRPFAYQPLYYLLLRAVMDVAQSHNEVLLKLVNVGFLWIALQGLLTLSQGWRLAARLFLLVTFSFNAYLFMHVLQIREYIVGVAFYVWSSWLTLQLLDRRLGRAWLDTAWFTAYGVLLSLGFFLQTWVVFVATAQGLFLVLYRRPERWRFYAHLTLSYIIVLSTTLPYLLANKQRVDVGRWGTEGTSLWSQVSHGFHLVLTGHLAGHSAFTDFLFWFWLAVMGFAAVLCLARRGVPGTGAGIRTERKAMGTLMLLSMAIPFCFQVGYFYRFDNLSVWPRYFVIHYFFFYWLLATAVHFLMERVDAPGLSSVMQRAARTVAAAALVIAMISAVYQVRSYYNNPYLDTSLSKTTNWRRISAAVLRSIQPGDLVLANDLIIQSTLTFSQPFPNRVKLLPQLEIRDIGDAPRLVYLEYSSNIPQRDALSAHMAGLGFKRMQVQMLPSSDGLDPFPEWRLLTFEP